MVASSAPGYSGLSWEGAIVRAFCGPLRREGGLSSSQNRPTGASHGGLPMSALAEPPIETVPVKKTSKTAPRATAESMAARQRDISVSEFFAKNRHLLGFDNPRKALLTTVKEAVDNSLDACEEAGIIPEIWVVVESTGNNRFKVSVQDNGPGIVK